MSSAIPACNFSFCFVTDSKTFHRVLGDISEHMTILEIAVTCREQTVLARSYCTFFTCFLLVFRSTLRKTPVLRNVTVSIVFTVFHGISDLLLIFKIVSQATCQESCIATAGLYLEWISSFNWRQVCTDQPLTVWRWLVDSQHCHISKYKMACRLVHPCRILTHYQMKKITADGSHRK